MIFQTDHDRDLRIQVRLGKGQLQRANSRIKSEFVWSLRIGGRGSKGAKANLEGLQRSSVPNASPISSSMSMIISHRLSRVVRR
jgi:hypothetical protein